MREELGVTLESSDVMSLRHGKYNDGTRFNDFYYVWPSLDENFVLNEGQRYAWFALDEAVSLHNLAEYAREDLLLFREQLKAPSGRRITSG
jgi:hypothetical protein